MNQESVIEQIAGYIEKKFKNEASGHDWWHIFRVWKLSRKLAEKEKDVNIFIVELGALLHDIADWKFSQNDEKEGGRQAEKLLNQYDLQKEIVQQVVDIVNNVSFKGAKVHTPMSSKEGQIVQDADRLDALGAIGIARTFAYGGYKNRPMYEPNVKPELHENFEAYKNSKSPTINHFYEKLLLLKNYMNTESGKEIANRRTAYMEEYLKRFHEEWQAFD